MELIGGKYIDFIDMYKNMVRQNILEKNYDTALVNLKKLKKCIKKCPKTDFGDQSCTISGLRFYHNVTSNIYNLKGRIKESLNHAQKACKLYQSKDDIAINKWALALIYEKINVQKADTIYRDLMLYYNLTRQKEYLADILNNRAYLRKEEEFAVTAIDIYQELGMNKRIESKMNTTLETLTDIYLKKGKYKLAKETIEKITDNKMKGEMNSLLFYYKKQFQNLEIC